MRRGAARQSHPTPLRQQRQASAHQPHGVPICRAAQRFALGARLKVDKPRLAGVAHVGRCSPYALFCDGVEGLCWKNIFVDCWLRAAMLHQGAQLFGTGQAPVVVARQSLALGIGQCSRPVHGDGCGCRALRATLPRQALRPHQARAPVGHRAVAMDGVHRCGVAGKVVLNADLGLGQQGQSEQPAQHHGRG